MVFFFPLPNTQLFQGMISRQIELEGRDRSVTLCQRTDIGALFHDPRGNLTTDPVVRAAARVLPGFQLVAIHAQPLAGDGNPFDLVIRQVRNVHVEQDIGGQFVGYYLSHHLASDARGRAIIPAPQYGFQANGARRQHLAPRRSRLPLRQ